MKLFITNKTYFENTFNYTKEIHINAFNELKKSIEVENSIPLSLFPNYDDEGICIFDFVTLKNNVYFYEFKGTAK